MLLEAMVWLWSLIYLGLTHYTLILLATIFVLYAIHWIRVRRYKQALFERLGIPYIKPHLIYGSMHTLRGTQKLATYIIGDWIEKYGKVFGYFTGDKPYVVVGDLDLMRQVLVKDFHNFSNRPKLVIEAQPVMDTVVGLRDQRWKDVRSVMAPVFTMAKMKKMTGIMNNRVDELLDIMAEHHKKNKPLEWYGIYQGLTLDVICECVLAMKTNCQREQNESMFFAATRSFLTNAMNPAIKLAIYFKIFGKFFTFISNHLALSGRMTNMIVSHLKTVLQIRRKEMSKNYIDLLQLMMDASESLLENEPSDTNNRDAIASDENVTYTEKTDQSTQKSPRGNHNKTLLSDEEIIANAWVFLLAGFETTAGALTSTSYLLACNPDIQEKLYEELCEAIEDGHQGISYETVHKLTYLDQVFAEALRILPPVVQFISRDTNEDFQLGDYFIPSDTNILIPIWQIHHDPELWPDPHKFDPERFSPEVKASVTRHPMSYIPFGAGPRGCPGIRFAQLESKLALARVFRCYRFEICDETPVPLTFAMPTVTHIPAKGVMIKAIPRE